VANLLATDASHLFATLPRGDWSLAAVDLVAIALAAGFAWMARRAARSPFRVRAPALKARALGEGA
jgi:hypothetical protein